MRNQSQAQKTEAIQISFEDLLGGNYNEPQFVKLMMLHRYHLKLFLKR
jgi:mannitol/fructose-specific phosphotransferase system IIA component